MLKSCQKLNVNLFCLFFFIFAALNLSQMEAAGWGNTQEVADYEGVKWIKVYIENNGYRFTAFLPNYSGASLQNDFINMFGKTENNYLITTTFNSVFKTPKSLNEFIKIVQDANPDFIVSAVDGKKLGAKYVVDLTPKNPTSDAFWRFVCTKDRLIQMGTADTNSNRRVYFFESFFVN